MTPHPPFKRLILRADLHRVSPMVIRVISVPDALDLPEFDEASRAVLGWDNIGHLPLSRPGVHPLSPGEPFENPARFPTATTRDLSAPAGRSICGNGNSV